MIRVVYPCRGWHGLRWYCQVRSLEVTGGYRKNLRVRLGETSTASLQGDINVDTEDWWQKTNFDSIRLDKGWRSDDGMLPVNTAGSP